MEGPVGAVTSPIPRRGFWCHAADRSLREEAGQRGEGARVVGTLSLSVYDPPSWLLPHPVLLVLSLWKISISFALCRFHSLSVEANYFI